jgi:Na+/H+-translocating membrane pyrophosphatase
MAFYVRQRPAAWFAPAVVGAVMWALAMCGAFLKQAVLGPEATHLPGLFSIVYAAAVLTGLCGAIALWFRSATAKGLFVVSLGTVVVQLSYVCLFTHATLPKGTMVMTVAIFGVAALEVWFSEYARQHGWIH